MCVCVGALVYEYEVKTGDRRKEREREEREGGEGERREKRMKKNEKAVQASINSQQSLQVQKKHNRNHMTIT